MSDAFSKDNQITDSRWLAVFCMYLGYRLVRLETPAAKKGKNKYTLSVPSNDWDIVNTEFLDPEVTVLRKSFSETADILQNFITRSKRNGGVWSCYEAKK
jgi:hypothetical protein